MFQNRSDAGIRLSTRLLHYKDNSKVIVLALPRGGVAIGYEIAHALNLPLDVLIVRKIGFPDNPELAVGAVAETGSIVLNKDIMEEGGLSEDSLKPDIERCEREIASRVAIYRAGKELPDLNGRTVILVDDGIATGATIKVAISALKKEGIAKLVLALPVGPPGTIALLRQTVDEMICLETPPVFTSVGKHYFDFTQIPDNEVITLLKKSTARVV